VRRVAELALDEGELLALRLPLQAVSILEVARDRFLQCDDLVGALIAQGCAALALARLGHMDELRSALSRLAEYYGRYASLPSFPGLPSWRRLVEVAENPDQDALASLVQSGWRLWLVRFIACIAAERDRREPAGRSRRVASWLRGKQVALPTELDGWLNAAGTVAEASVAKMSQPDAKLFLMSSFRRSQGTMFQKAPVSITAGEQDGVSHQIEMPDLLSPYRTAAEQLLGPMRGALERITSPVVALSLDRFAAWVCWEAVLQPYLTQDSV
jgi:hypothetical protein